MFFVGWKSHPFTVKPESAKYLATNYGDILAEIERTLSISTLKLYLGVAFNYLPPLTINSWI